MVRLLGFEPRTSWSVAKRSIQLSYRRQFFKIKKYNFLKFIHGINNVHKKMQLLSKINSIKKIYLSLLVALIPFSFIAGNMLININILLLILSAIILFGSNLFKIKYYLLDKFIFLYFLIILSTGLINDIFTLNKTYYGTDFAVTVKSILFLKYLLLYLVIRFLLEREIIDLKFFFITCSVASIFVCFDLFYQYIYDVDIFGNKTLPGRKLGGPFGDELIAGGFVQRFSIFSFFLLPLYYADKTYKFIKYIIPILFIIFFIGIILSGNRMPLLLFIFCVTLILIFQKQTRKFFLPFIVIFPIIFFSVLSLNDKAKSNFKNFYTQVTKMAIAIVDKDFQSKSTPQYFKEFATFYDTWLINKYIGGGIKSFRYYCHVRPNIDPNSKFVCNMHPHNYYLEILTETGLVGFLTIITIFSIVLYQSLYKKYFSNSSLQYNHFTVPFIFLFFVEIFPIKSTGSFFTTGNATYLFLILAILIALIRKDNSIEKRY